MNLTERAKKQEEANALWAIIFAINSNRDKVPGFEGQLTMMRDVIFEHGQQNYSNNFRE